MRTLSGSTANPASARAEHPRGADPLARRTALLALGGGFALMAGGCATRPAPVDTDGLPAALPANLERVPDAVPRVEPIRAGGPNKPYEVDGRLYVPFTADRPLREVGGASWYGRKYHGRPTASGEPYDMFAMTAAHTTMPIPSFARVFNPANGRSVIVRVNDRGPFVPGRVIDLSYTAALRLGVHRAVAPVEVRRLTLEEIRSGAWRRLALSDPPADHGPALPSTLASAQPVAQPFVLPFALPFVLPASLPSALP